MKKSLFFLFITIFYAGLLNGQVYTFTNCSATGIDGPTQGQITTAYTNTSLAGLVTSSSGIQLWTVPSAGNYKIEVYGAEGYGTLSGKGAYMSGEFMLSGGTQLKILVGQQGGCCVGSGTNQYGGGGGSFVVTSANVPLIIAGGGGGARYNTAVVPSSHGTINNNGNPGAGSANGTAGTNGGGGGEAGSAGGGGGFSGNGGGTPHGGKSFMSGGQGGTASSNGGKGGFGGGGGANSWDNGRGGGGGGYSGGGGAGSSGSAQQVGGGGGSYNTGANQNNLSGVRSAHGLVVITMLTPPVANDAGVSALPSLSAGICPGNIMVTAKVDNNGTTPVDSVFVNWSVNGLVQGGSWHKFTPALSPTGNTNSSQVVNLSNYNFTSGTFVVKAWTSMPNSVIDGNFNNDTITFTSSTKLAGIYTVNNNNPTAGTNFNNFTDLANALNNIGVCGPVTVNVNAGSGPYNERFLLGNIPGTSNINTVRINGNGRTLQFNPGSTNDMNLVVFNGTKHVTLDSLHIKTLNATYGYGITITNGSKYDSIINCHIDLSYVTGSSSTSASGIAITGSLTSPTTSGFNGSNIYIGNNIIDAGTENGMYGAYYAVSLYGSSSTAMGLDSVYVINNEIKNYYYYGIYAYYGYNCIISDNLIHKEKKIQTSSTYGLAAYYINGIRVERNIVRDFAPTYSSTNTTYGILVNYSNKNGLYKSKSYVLNNLIYNIGSQGGAIYGIYLYDSDSTYLYHNTIDINLTHPTATSTQYGFYIWNQTNSLFVKNNNVNWTGGNQGTKHGIYAYSANMFNVNVGLQNNNVFMNSSQGGTQNRVYYNSTAYANLAAFQLAFPALEVNGIEADPLYLDYPNGDLTPLNIDVLKKGENLLSVVPTDILFHNRPTPPTPGAFDILPEWWDNAGVQMLNSPLGNFCSGYRSVQAKIENAGFNDINNLLIDWTVNGVPQPQVVFNSTIDGTLTSNNNTANVTLGTAFIPYGYPSQIKIWTSLPNNNPDGYNSNDTLVVFVNPTSTLTVNIGPDTTICDGVVYNLNAGDPTQLQFDYEWDNASTLYNRDISAAGNYWVIKTNKNTQCSGHDTAKILTNPSPDVNLGADTGLCSTDTIMLSVGPNNASNTIVWDDNSGASFRYITIPGTYSVTVTNNFGCSDYDEIIVGNREEPYTDGINAVYMLNATYNFSLKNPMFVDMAIWDFGDGSPVDTGFLVSHQYATNGYYKVTTKLISNCNVDAYTIYSETVDAIGLGVNHNILTTGLDVYPNPATDQITVAMQNDIKINHLQVINVLGQVVYNVKNVNASKHHIDTKKLSSGVYQIKVDTDNGFKIVKFEVVK